MTDILLSHSFFLKNDPKQVQKMRPYPPLGTLYAASYLRSRGYSVALFDAMLSAGEEEFEAMLDEQRPPIVALYEDQFNFLNKMCLTHSREAACRMSRAARARGATVIAAGSDVTDHPEVYFRHGVQYALLGEADHGLCELVDVLTEREERSLECIPGLAVPDPFSAGGVRRNVARVPERHPDVFPFPAWDLVDVERYRAAWMQAQGHFSINMASTRGCPFHCNWCAKPIWGQRYAMRSPANVAEEMTLVKRTLQPDHIWFADDIFGLQPQWVAEFAQEVEVRQASIPFMIQSRVDLMTEKAVEALARAGCVEVWLGVESGCQKIADAMDKGIRLPEVAVVRQRLRRAGIRACFFIQFGYPGETFEDIMATVRLVRETLPEEIGISVSNPLPGTKFYDMVKAQLGEKDHWDDSDDLAMMFQGAYQTPFYRKLHQMLHRDLEIRQKLRATAIPDPAALQQAETIDREWLELSQTEFLYRSLNPTAIRKSYHLIEAPDLSERWN